LHDNVDDEGSTAQPQLRTLPIQVGDWPGAPRAQVLARTPPRSFSTRSTVRSLKPACIAIFANPVRMAHGYSWRFFGGFLALTRQF
jgi:hypothetical protein